MDLLQKEIEKLEKIHPNWRLAYDYLVRTYLAEDATFRPSGLI